MSKKCPCCHQPITFRAFFKAWSYASKYEKLALECPSCKQAIGKTHRYNHYTLIASIPLFSIPFVGEGYGVSLLVLIYGLLFFIYIYQILPFECIEIDQLEEVKQENTQSNEIGDRIMIGIIMISFYVILIWMMLGSVIEYKQMKKQEQNSTKVVEK